jgi:hypothetical protein
MDTSLALAAQGQALHDRPPHHWLVGPLGYLLARLVAALARARG